MKSKNCLEPTRKYKTLADEDRLTLISLIVNEKLSCRKASR